MKNSIAALALTGMLIALPGCSQSNDGGPRAEASATPKAAKTVSVTPTPGQKVEVSTGGTEFDPSVPASSLPDGSWACIMKDQVHYASADKGTGKCTVCGMNLVQTGTPES